MSYPNKLTAAVALLASLLVVFLTRPAEAHCDTMDGPVIAAARRALETGDIHHAFVWVQPADESAIQQAFDEAREQRVVGGEQQAAADTRFFEAFVRIHRAGEGAPYTGIKPAGTPVEPAVKAADAALDASSPEQVEHLLVGAVQAGLAQRFRSTTELKNYAPTDVTAGRAYVKAYVDYTHFVERVHGAATTSGHGEHAADGHSAASAHDSHNNHLPWVLAVVLGLALVGETGFVIARRRMPPVHPAR